MTAGQVCTYTAVVCTCTPRQQRNVYDCTFNRDGGFLRDGSGFGG
jgi:hypothetical protein